MKSREIAFMGLMLAMGFILHAFIPGIFLGMKPDMQQVMMFLSLTMFTKRDQATIMIIGTALLCALTTTFPGGQIPNIIDKLIVGAVFLNAYKIGKKSVMNISILTGLCTLLSGAIFLTTALFIVGLPTSISALFMAVVLPTAIVNALAMFFLYPLMNRIKSVTKITI